jgi:hypothetical protein
MYIHRKPIIVCNLSDNWNERNFTPIRKKEREVWDLFYFNEKQ